MADITMCTGFGKDSNGNRVPCPSRETCYRHAANANEHWQAYFAVDLELYEHDTGDSACEMYWKVADERT